METVCQRMEQEMKLRGYSPRTIAVYVRAVRSFGQHFDAPPERLDPEDARAYLLHLTEVRKVSASAGNQVAAALRLFYGKVLRRPAALERLPFRKRPRRLPVVLSRGEILALLRAPENLKHRAVLMTLYAGGLRLSEALALRAEDIDSRLMRIRIRCGKGGKERYVMLSATLLATLREYWRQCRPRTWLFPSVAKDKPLGSRTVQRIFDQARKKAGVTKPVTPHTLRHSFATHLLEAGAPVPYIQELLGHRSVKTTMLYARVRADTATALRSPLDELMPI